MRFISFIKQLTAQPDNDLQAFINYAKRDKKFPLSSNPYLLGLYLHNKLNEKSTLGYMKAMMVYSQQEGNMLTKKLKDPSVFLQALNCIIYFQQKGT